VSTTPPPALTHDSPHARSGWRGKAVPALYLTLGLALLGLELWNYIGMVYRGEVDLKWVWDELIVVAPYLVLAILAACAWFRPHLPLVLARSLAIACALQFSINEEMVLWVRTVVFPMPLPTRYLLVEHGLVAVALILLLASLILDWQHLRRTAAARPGRRVYAVAGIVLGIMAVGFCVEEWWGIHYMLNLMVRGHKPDIVVAPSRVAARAYELTIAGLALAAVALGPFAWRGARWAAAVLAVVWFGVRLACWPITRFYMVPGWFESLLAQFTVRSLTLMTAATILLACASWRLARRDAEPVPHTGGSC
jgi:hypothetical protein